MYLDKYGEGIMEIVVVGGFVWVMVGFMEKNLMERMGMLVGVLVGSRVGL